MTDLEWLKYVRDRLGDVAPDEELAECRAALARVQAAAEAWALVPEVLAMRGSIESLTSGEIQVTVMTAPPDYTFYVERNKSPEVAMRAALEAAKERAHD